MVRQERTPCFVSRKTTIRPEYWSRPMTYQQRVTRKTSGNSKLPIPAFYQRDIRKGHKPLPLDNRELKRFPHLSMSNLYEKLKYIKSVKGF